MEPTDNKYEENTKSIFPKSFSSPVSFFQYSYQNILMLMGIAGLMIWRVSNNRYEKYFYYFFIVCFFAAIVILYYRYSKYGKHCTYIFEKNKIIRHRSGVKDQFLYDDLKDSATPDDKAEKAAGGDYLTLYFIKNRKLTFSLKDPHFHEIKDLLTEIYAKKGRRL